MRVLSGRQAENLVRKLERRGSSDLARVETRVRRIVEEVRKEGDKALRRYAEQWDGLGSKQPLRVSPDELRAAWHATTEEFRAALRTAAVNIRYYSERQMPQEWRSTNDYEMNVGQIVRPLESAGCYVPGGRYPLPSTLLMTVIPAQVAGVREIRVVSPRPATETLATAYFLQVAQFYRVGGAQAVAALAYGTKSIPQVDKIVGPGNLFVTAAKKLVAFDCAIDFLAGPTEVLIVSHHGEPRYIAADLVAQSEHDPDTLAIFITSSRQLARQVDDEVNHAVGENKIAKAAMARSGAILVVDSCGQAMEFANRIAFEHITVEEEDLPQVRNAGSVFVGDYSAQAAGDYAVGPNHVLPTCGGARFRAGLSVTDFLKTISVQHLSRKALDHIASTIITLAQAEGLAAHAESIRVRCAHD
ncbi:MAG TPA: histidinol dehydrogenase [Candidatus Angelobacter sp.]